MKGFIYSGIMLIIIFVMLFALMSLSNYYGYFGKKIYLKYEGDNVYQTTIDAARLISYAKQNIMQDALSDSIALATERSLNSEVSNYTYVEVNLSVPNNISGVNSIVDLNDDFPVSCYYKADSVYFSNTSRKLVISNISKVVCVGNDHLSTQVLLCEKYDNTTNTTYNITIYNYWAYSNWTGLKFIGCKKSKILNTSEFINLTKYNNYTWYYLIRNKTLFENFLKNKVLIGDTSNLSINISEPKRFTFSGNYSIDRSKSLKNPNYDVLKRELYYDIDSPGEYGGITGTGFENLSCSSKNNYGSNTNCEGEPFISNYTSNYEIEKPIQIPLKVCKELSKNNYNLIQIVLKNYAIDTFAEMLSKTYGKKNIKILDVYVNNYPVNCINITTSKGFNFTIDVCVKYNVISQSFNKINIVCSKRIVWFDFHEKTFGSDTNIKTPHGKYAYRIFYKQPNKLFLQNATYFLDTYYRKLNCSIMCRENITGIKYTGEKLFYSDIKVIDILRSGIDPDNFLFDHPFHILTTNYKKSQIYSVCDSVNDLVNSGKSCNDIQNLIKEEFNYLNNSKQNIKTKIKPLTDTSALLEISVSDKLYPEFASDIRYKW